MVQFLKTTLSEHNFSVSSMMHVILRVPFILHLIFLLSIVPCYNNKEQVPVIFLKVKENVPVEKNKGHY